MKEAIEDAADHLGMSPIMLAERLTMPRPRHLVDAANIARRLGVVSSAVVAWRRRGTDDFPAPVVAPGLGARVWDWRQVEAWAKRTGRLER